MNDLETKGKKGLAQKMPLILITLALFLAPGAVIYAFRTEQSTQQRDRRNKVERVAKVQKLSVDVTSTFLKVDELFMAKKGDEALQTLRPLLESPDSHVRERAYHELASLWSDPKIRGRVHQKLEDAARDASPEVRSKYPMYLVLSAAPDSLRRAREFTRSPDPATREAATSAVQWGEQHGPGAG